MTQHKSCHQVQSVFLSLTMLFFNFPLLLFGPFVLPFLPTYHILSQSQSRLSFSFLLLFLLYLFLFFFAFTVFHPFSSLYFLCSYFQDTNREERKISDGLTELHITQPCWFYIFSIVHNERLVINLNHNYVIYFAASPLSKSKT